MTMGREPRHMCLGVLGYLSPFLSDPYSLFAFQTEQLSDSPNGPDHSLYCPIGSLARRWSRGLGLKGTDGQIWEYSDGKLDVISQDRDVDDSKELCTAGPVDSGIVGGNAWTYEVGIRYGRSLM